jgi:hypothetical protein
MFKPVRYVTWHSRMVALGFRPVNRDLPRDFPKTSRLYVNAAGERVVARLAQQGSSVKVMEVIPS